MSAEDTLQQQSSKSWWQRPENWFTYGGLGVVGYFVLKGLDTILPLLNSVLENALYTAVLAGAAGLIGWLLVNKDVHKLAWYGYRMLMKWVTRRFIEIDPIAILESYVETLKEKYQEIVKSLATLKSQRQSLKRLIELKTQEHDNAMRLASEAKKRGSEEGMRAEFALQARKAGRLEKSTITYQGLLNSIDQHIAMTERFKQASSIMIEDINGTVDEEKEKRVTVRASYKAMKASSRILMAGKDSEMYDMALESVQADYFQKMGEIEQFMDDSKSFLNGMDLQNGVFEEDALNRINDWDKRSVALLEGKKLRVENTSTSSSEIDDGDVVHEEESKQRQSYANLFDK